MKKYLFGLVIIILISLINNNVYGQYLYDYSKDLSVIMKVNQELYTIKRHGEYNNQLYIVSRDTVPIDTLEYNPTKYIYLKESNVLYYIKKNKTEKDKIYSYNFINTTNSKHTEYDIGPNERIAGYIDNIMVLYKEKSYGDIWRKTDIIINYLNLNDGQKTIKFKDNITNVYEDRHAIFRDFSFSENLEKLLVITGKRIRAKSRMTMEPYKGYIIDIQNEDINRFNTNLLNKKGSGNFIKSSFDNNLILKSSETSKLGKTTSRDQYILNDKFELISECLYRDYEIYGYEYTNNVRKKAFLESQLDNGEKKILTQPILGGLEILFYKIYHNKEIKKEDLSNKNLFHLKLMKNMVFAKHNYKFDTKYYQAFFNQYYFYSEKRDSRTKKVNSHLTDIDKHNLKLIKEEIEKRKE